MASLALIPLYVRPSGTPQISHIVMVGAIVATYIGLGAQLPRQYIPTTRALLAFVLTVVFVNGLWDIAANSTNVLRVSAFYIFNYFVFRSLLMMYLTYGRELLVLTLNVLTATVALLATLALAQGGTVELRSAAFFNNPNQLAYYGVIVATVAAIGGRYLQNNVVVQAGALISSAVLVAAANSKAGLLAFFVLTLILFFSQTRLAVIVLLSVAAISLFVGSASTLQNDIETRLSTIQADDTAEARGYYLLVDHPSYLVLGAGENNYARFGRNIEIHSTFGTVAFAYGIAGMLTFGLFFYRAIRLVGPRPFLFLVPVFLYGLAHNGLRFTMLWVLIAFTIASTQMVTPNHTAASRQSRRSRINADGVALL